ncbi:MAG: hypothetical protein KKA16_09890 [Alphaproteobacteria bacterium]|uniref:Uncharacterized protein n=1 Tax=viral metagenome TaxID=1070528 RepID=A0A6H1ZJY4_9ZZZZ|nr:hypothetical protein [Alphaproteobacteria bacterium]MBU2377874.1 hypothetical protein [Alphaproteobacteria bacterium]
MIPTFHDGNLIGLSVAKAAATLTLARSDGVAWQIELSGVRYLKADDFREGNIVNYCQAITKADPPRGLLEALAGGPHGSAAPEYHEKHRLFIDDLAEQVGNGSLTLLIVEPSYGCELLAISERVEASEVR